MLLATYQPINQNPNTNSSHQHKHDAVANVLGYYPIWCISAETIEEFLCQSLFCAPNYGEELIIFETDEYDTIDKCKWYESIKNNDETIDPTWINSDCRFKEYLVKEIDNVIFRIPVNLNTFSMEATDAKHFDDLTQALYNKTKELQSTVMIANLNGKAVPANPYRNPYHFQAYIATSIVTGFLAFIYSMTFCGDISDYLRFFGTEHTIEPLLMKFHIWNEHDCTEENYVPLVEEFYKMFEKNLDVAIRKRQGKIGRNEICPCGSGKKYKKCCGKNG